MSTWMSWYLKAAAGHAPDDTTLHLNPTIPLQLPYSNYSRAGDHSQIHLDDLLATAVAVLQAWKKTKQSSSLLQLQSGSAQLTLTFKPLRVDLSIAGTPAASFNARQMFNYEHLRQKQVIMQRSDHQCQIIISTSSEPWFCQMQQARQCEAWQPDISCRAADQTHSTAGLNSPELLETCCTCGFAGA